MQDASQALSKMKPSVGVGLLALASLIVIALVSAYWSRPSGMTGLHNQTAGMPLFTVTGAMDVTIYPDISFIPDQEVQKYSISGSSPAVSREEHVTSARQSFKEDQDVPRYQAFVSRSISSKCVRTVHLQKQALSWFYAEKANTHLSHICSSVSFHYNPGKLVYLENVLARLLAFPTNMDITVVTDDAASLSTVVQDWNLSSSVDVKGFDVSREANPYALLWKHREVMEHMFLQTPCTALMHLEDDTDLTWGAMQSWALDTAVLEPLNFTRGFIRTEYGLEGRRMAMDATDIMRVASYGGQGTAEAQCSSYGGRVSHHLYYVQLRESYYGFWVVTRRLMEQWLRSNMWTEYELRGVSVQGTSPWFPEKTNWMHQFIGVPPSFPHTSLVPYDPITSRVCPDTYVRHLRNGYVGTNRNRKAGLGWVATDRLLVLDRTCASETYTLESH